MNDQPHDQPTNQEPTNHDHDRDQPPTDHTTTPTWVTMEQAAKQLGITVNAVRQRIKRETLSAIKTDEGWLVDMSATDQRPKTKRPPTAATNQPTNHATMPIDHTTIDLASLTDLIERQAQDLQRLTETAQQDELIDQLRSEVEYLRERLTATQQQLASERERADVLHREALGRIEALTATVGERQDATGQPGQGDEEDDGPAVMQVVEDRVTGILATLRRLLWRGE